MLRRPVFRLTKQLHLVLSAVFSTAFSFAATVNVPAGADIQAAIDANPAGTVFQLSAGIYRMQSLFPKDGDQILGALDTSGKRATILTGAQPLTSFTRDAYGNFVATTTQTQPGQQTGQCVWGFSRCNLPEDFFYDNEPYQHNSVGGSSITPGQYFFDYPSGRILFKPKNSADDPSQHTVEYSRQRVAVAGTNVSGVTVKNLIVEKYAIPDQFGAIGDQYPGQAWIIQNNEIRLNHGQGIHVASNSQVLDNYIHDNGQMGLGGSGSNILLQGNEIAHNVDYTGTDCGWECGAFKFVFTDGLTVRNNNSHDNTGPGMWTDISNIRTLYENNIVTNNSGPGIFHEISYDAVIRNNTIKNNGSFAPDDWFWNAQLQISTSQNVEAYGNIIEVNSANNGNGIMLIQQNRSNDACNYGPCKVANNYIHDNVITVTGTRWHGSTGAAQDFTGYGDVFAAASNNRFAANQYHVTDVNSAAYWDWANNYQTFSGFRSFGQEANGSVDANFSGDTAAPSIPSGLNATAVSGTQINLSWGASTDNVAVTGYKVFRDGVQIATTTAPSFADTGLALSVAYSYAVAAFDAVGNLSARSATVSATTKTPVIQVGGQVVTTAQTTVRNKPGTTAGSRILGGQALGSHGKVLQGPQKVSGQSWWYVNFDSGIDGWVTQATIAAY